MPGVESEDRGAAGGQGTSVVGGVINVVTLSRGRTQFADLQAQGPRSDLIWGTREGSPVVTRLISRLDASVAQSFVAASLS